MEKYQQDGSKIYKQDEAWILKKALPARKFGGMPVKIKCMKYVHCYQEREQDLYSTMLGRGASNTK